MFVAAVAAACARNPQVLPSPPPAACDDVVNAEGVPIGRRVEWERPVAKGDARRLERWCEAVGPMVFASPAPGSASPGARRDATLAVVGWNVHVGHADLVSFVGDLREGRFTEGRPPSEYVLLLQEAVRRGASVPADPPAGAPVPDRIPVPALAPDIVETARRLGLHLFYAPSMRNGDNADAPDEDRGNAILSTVPLFDPEVIELPFERQRRVAITAAIAWPPERPTYVLRLVTAHLDNLAGARRLWIGAAGARARQARGLASALADDRYVLLAADLNTWAGTAEPAHRLLARRLRPAENDPRPTFIRGTRLDYLFSRLPPHGRLEQVRLDDRFGSDHYPLVGRLSLPGSGAAGM